MADINPVGSMRDIHGLINTRVKTLLIKAMEDQLSLIGPSSE